MRTSWEKTRTDLTCKTDGLLKDSTYDKIKVGRASLIHGRVEDLTPNQVDENNFPHLNLEVEKI